MTNRCFLLQPPSSKHDLSQLEDYGVPVVLFSRGFYPDDVYIYTNRINQILDDMLDDLDPDNDHFVPMGDSCVVAQVVYWLSEERLLPVSFLKYDKKLRGFYQVQIGEPRDANPTNQRLV